MAVLLSWLAFAIAAVSATSIVPRANSSDPLASCPGYTASNVKTTSSGLTADLSLAGTACNVYGGDLKQLTLEVVYETGQFRILPCHSLKISNSIQMIESMSRFRMLPTVYIKFRRAFFLALLPPAALIPSKPTSNSHTKSLHSPSQ